MTMYTISREQYVTSTLAEAWDLLKNPANLDLITPPDLQFQIISPVPEEMFEGLLVEYRIKIPWFGLRTWVAEIKHIREFNSFVDEQRIGPYTFWYHYHQIDEVDGRVRLIDRVYYEVPFSIFGTVIHFFFIRKNLKRIFDFRQKKLAELLSINSSE
jgi:ligand-binding SRPBCC domain-containing protein